ncbi:MAG: hypothetical protein U5K37_11705 [Natrialbaceae archaeon]|nr:hypothetical protein [Natrialbaceae archaeon]
MTTSTSAIDADINNKLQKTLLICDEVHNMGSETLDRNGSKENSTSSGTASACPPHLSIPTTPNGTTSSGKKSVPSSIEFDLDDAIRRGILCEVDYTPLFYELSAKDKERQQDAFGRFQGMKKRTRHFRKASYT